MTAPHLSEESWAPAPAGSVPAGLARRRSRLELAAGGKPSCGIRGIGERTNALLTVRFKTL